MVGQREVWPGEGKLVAGGGDQHVVLPGVAGHTAGCVTGGVQEFVKPGEDWQTTGWYLLEV